MALIRDGASASKYLEPDTSGFLTPAYSGPGYSPTEQAAYDILGVGAPSAADARAKAIADLQAKLTPGEWKVDKGTSTDLTLGLDKLNFPSMLSGSKVVGSGSSLGINPVSAGGFFAPSLWGEAYGTQTRYTPSNAVATQTSLSGITGYSPSRSVSPGMTADPPSAISGKGGTTGGGYIGAGGFPVVGTIKEGAGSKNETPLGNQAVEEAKKKYGLAAYVYGGFDCSAFTQQTSSSVGVKIPRDTGSQIPWFMAREKKGLWTTDINQAQPGDLLFFDSPNGGDSKRHVGMYLKPGWMIDNNGSGVDYRKIGGRGLIGVGRLSMVGYAAGTASGPVDPLDVDAKAYVYAQSQVGGDATAFLAAIEGATAKGMSLLGADESGLSDNQKYLKSLAERRDKETNLAEALGKGYQSVEESMSPGGAYADGVYRPPPESKSEKVDSLNIAQIYSYLQENGYDLGALPPGPMTANSRAMAMYKNAPVGSDDLDNFLGRLLRRLNENKKKPFKVGKITASSTKGTVPRKSAGPSPEQLNRNAMAAAAEKKAADSRRAASIRQYGPR